MKNKLLTFCTILSLFFVLLPASKAFAGTYIDVSFEDTPLFNETDDGVWMPGYSKTKSTVVTNKSGEDQIIKVKAKNDADLDNLGSRFDFWIYDSGKTYFLGSIHDFLSAGEVILATQTNNIPNTYYFFAQFSKSSGNEWKNKKLGFDLELRFDGDDITDGGKDDGVHLVCAPTNQCVIAQGEGDNDSGCSSAGDGCNYVGTGDLPSDSITTFSTSGSGVAGASTGGGSSITGGLEPQGGEVEGESSTQGEQTLGISDVGGVADTRGQCCCLWWLFILGQLLVQIGYLIKIKGYKTTYGRLALVYLASALGFYILYRLLCSWLTSIIGCIWPSVYLLQFCRWYILIALFVLILGALPYFLIRSKKGKPTAPPKTQSFLKDQS